jgi:hypothetical protein
MAASHAKTINEIAIMMGDRSLESSLPYFQTSEPTKQKIADNLLKAYQELCGEAEYQKLYKFARKHYEFTLDKEKIDYSDAV